jgi:signal transduction histidine kinase
VEKILYFARLEAVHKDYFLEPVVLPDACREAVEEQRALLDESGFSVEFVGEGKQGDGSLSPAVISDRKGLAFILGQIIGNSIKYAGVSGMQPELRFEVLGDIDADADSDAIVLQISDNGPGVPQADLPFIFDKGFTGEQGNRPGHATGMGLYLAHRMARDLTIELDAHSKPGEGLTISLSFPSVKK